MKVISIFLIVFAAGSCGREQQNNTSAPGNGNGNLQGEQTPAVREACIDSSLINPDAMCIQVYKPVCGCNDKTYSNECTAKNAGVTSWEDGECPED